MVYARRASSPKPRKAQNMKWPAPVAGWVSNRALSTPESIEGPGAAVLDDFFPRSTGVALRRGKSRYATLEDESLDVGALFTYHDGSTERMFAANNTTIYDVSNIVFAQPQDIGTQNDDELGDGLGNVFGWNSTAGYSIADGYTSDDWSTIQFATTGGIFLVGVNGADEGFIYDGSDIYPFIAGGVWSLAFDAETDGFTVGDDITGGTSGATATIVRVDSDGSTGTLLLRDITGTFADNEVITGLLSGSADVNGTQQSAAPGADFGSLTSADMSFVWAYKNRLYFCQKNSLSVWYLDVDSIGGTATEFPMGGIFANGGSLIFGQRWSLESGSDGGLSEQNIFVTTEGEVAIYQGTSPDEAATWTLVGVYRIGAPLGKRAYIRGGGDIAIATTVGLVPLSKAIQLDVTALNTATVSYKIADAWTDAIQLRGEENWQCIVWPQKKMAIVAPPDMVGSSSPVMFVSNTETGAWGRYRNWQGLSFAVYAGQLYFGSTDGRIYQAETGGLDDGETYSGAVVPLFNDMGFPAGVKVGKAVRARVRATTRIIDDTAILADFDLNLPVAPDATPPFASNQWGSAVWGESKWDASTPSVINQEWRSAGSVGYSLAPCYQVTSGAPAPIDVEVIDFESLHTTAEALT